LSGYTIRLVEIMPIEYHKARLQLDRKKGKVLRKAPRLLIYWDFTVDPGLSQEKMEKMIHDVHMKKKAVVLENPDERIEYKYDREPNIIFLKKYPNKVFTTKAILDEYGEGKCQQQASIVMRMLRKYGYATFKQTSATFDPKRVGRTPEERKIVVKAMKNLFGD
jgi:hypothetical protein